MTPRLTIVRLSPWFRSRSVGPERTTNFEWLMKLDRRTFLTASLGLAAGASTTAVLNRPKFHVTRRQPRSRAAILRAESYCDNLESILHSGLSLFHLDLRGKTVLLKPNLVDYIPGNHINTHPLLVSAAVECFRRLGAK